MQSLNGTSEEAETSVEQATRDGGAGVPAPLVAATEMARLALGKRATDEQWDLNRCQRAAAARLDIVRGINAAATWALAIYGEADRDVVEFIAWQGVRGAEEARQRWAKTSTMLCAIKQSALRPALVTTVAPVTPSAANGIMVRTKPTYATAGWLPRSARPERVRVCRGARR